MRNNIPTEIADTTLHRARSHLDSHNLFAILQPSQKFPTFSSSFLIRIETYLSVYDFSRISRRLRINTWRKYIVTRGVTEVEIKFRKYTVNEKAEACSCGSKSRRDKYLGINREQQIK